MICCAIIILFLIFNYADSTKNKRGYIGYGTKPTTERPTVRPRPQPK